MTVVIPARDAERTLARCLDSVLGQDRRALQVVVVDRASRDRTREIAREYLARDPRVELLFNPDENAARAMNMALWSACGRWLVRVDADAATPRGALSALVP